MSRIFDGLSQILRLPSGYRLFQQMVGADHSRQVYLGNYAKPVAGEKILDIGCGPADILNYLPAVNYTGLDLSPEYINSATAQFGDKGRFCCGDVGLATIDGEHGTFDLVMSIGVLHHLDNAQADKLLDLARRALRPGGRLVTYDGCYVPDQSRIARWMLSRDRGKFIRAPEEYQRLAAAHFSKVDASLRNDLLRIPYNHIIMSCSN
jgi:SAM-dependent methyltransferase